MTAPSVPRIHRAAGSLAGHCACGAELRVPVSGPTAKRCPRCRRRAGQDNSNAKARRDRCGRARQCRRCDQPSERWRQHCAAHQYRPRRLGPLEVECRQCAGPLNARRITDRYCSPLCHNRAKYKREWNAGSRRRFPHFQVKQRLAIAERDGWRCGLCGAIIDQALRWPHPGSLSIDHIDPDGEHVPENWQASHLVCNVQAGDKRAAA